MTDVYADDFGFDNESDIMTQDRLLEGGRKSEKQEQEEVQRYAETAKATNCLYEDLGSISEFSRGLKDGTVSEESAGKFLKGSSDIATQVVENLNVLEQGVAEGTVTQEQYDQAKADVEAMGIDKFQVAVDQYQETGDPSGLRDVPNVSDDHMVDLRMKAQDSKNLLLAADPNAIFKTTVIHNDGTTSEYNENLADIVKYGSKSKAETGRGDGIVDYSHVQDEEQKEAEIAADAVIQAQARGIDLSEEKALEIARRFTGKHHSGNVNYDDIFGRPVKDEVALAEYNAMRGDLVSDFKGYGNLARESGLYDGTAGDSATNMSSIERKEKKELLRAELAKIKNKIRTKERKVAEVKRDRRKNEKRKELARSNKKRKEIRSPTKKKNTPVTSGRSPVKRGGLSGHSGGGGTPRYSGPSSGGGPISSSSGGSSAASSSNGGGNSGSPYYSDKPSVSESGKTSSTSRSPGRTIPAKNDREKKVEKKTNGRSIASVEPEKEATKGGAVESRVSQKKKKEPLLTPEMAKRLAKYLYLDWDKLPPGHKKAYEELMTALYKMMNTSLLKEDYEKLKEKYLVRSGRKLYLDKAVFFEIEDDTDFVIFLVRSLAENADLIDNFYLKAGPKGLKMDFHHSGENEAGAIVGFASKNFKDSGFEEILRTKNFERMMEINVTWEEANQEARKTSEKSSQEKQPEQTKSGLAKR